MIVENHGQQQSMKFIVDTENAVDVSGASVAAWKMYGSGTKKTDMHIRSIRMNVYCVCNVKWIV